MDHDRRYPPIDDYAFVADCHSNALVSRRGSIDWCVVPRPDAASVFGRLLDWDRGGYYQIAPTAESFDVERRYLDGSLVVETTFCTADGEVRLIDGFAMRRGGREEPRRQLLRIVEGRAGEVELAVRIAPRFHYGRTRPWIRRHGERRYTAIGGESGLAFASDVELEIVDEYDLVGSVRLAAGERRRISMVFEPPHRLYPREPEGVSASEIDGSLEETLEWWRHWSQKIDPVYDEPGMRRSAVVLKGLTYAPTGAIVAAATTSLPEAPGGERNWDYRFSWVRDSSFAARSLERLGCNAEAAAFEDFIERTTAGGANELQLMYGVDGRRYLEEQELDWLEGYRGARPVRIGNAAHRQTQLDIYGELLEVAWRGHRRGRSPDDDLWRFLGRLIDNVTARWAEPDHGIWEVRGEPRHFVHSKVMCWTAVDRMLRLAAETGREGPIERWESCRQAIRQQVESEGYDDERGIFRRSYGERAVDGALLQLPVAGFVAYDDPRMLRTVEAIQEDLCIDGFVQRYRVPDGLRGGEGTFLACTFWLVECLARQGKLDEAEATFAATAAAANDLGLFAEEYDPRGDTMLGNFPQGLTHYSHLSAALALAEVRGELHSEDQRDELQRSAGAGAES